MNGETLYFNSWFSATEDGITYRYSKHVFIGSERLVTRVRQERDYNWDSEDVTTYYYHPDHLGSVSVVSNHQGVPYERVEYLPFGEVWIEDVDAATRYIPFRFTSKELDRETGLYYYGARYYEPKVSRWMSADPAGFALINPNRGGYSVIEATNWYAYVSNNPVNYVDPTGMYDWEDFDTGLPKENYSPPSPYPSNGGGGNRPSSSSSDSGDSGSGGSSSSNSSSTNSNLADTQAALNASLNGTVHSLDNEINIGEAVILFKSYSYLLDKKTEDFVNNASEEELIAVLLGVTIYVLNAKDMGLVQETMESEGVESYIDDPAGIGIGTSIYIDKDAFRNDTTGELLGHEAVHILQAAAHGSLEGMLEAYGNDMDGMETAAYEFGGYHKLYSRKTQRKKAKLPPVFQEHPIRRK